MAEPEQQKVTIEQASDLALQHFTAGRMDEAENIFQQILLFDPNQPVALHRLGVISHLMGKHDIAVDLITKSLAIKPGFAEAHSALGNVFQVLGRLDESVASYHKALSINPDFAEAHNNLGGAFQDMGRLDEAAESFDKAINIKPDYAEAHSNLGHTFKELERLDEAVASFQKSLDIKADQAGVHCNLGATLQALGRLDEAVTSCHKALAIRPDYAEAHNNLGLALHGLGRLDEAVASYGMALAIKPDLAQAHSNLGNALRAQKRLDAAIEAFDRAIALQPDLAEAHWNKAFTLLLGGDFANGWKLYEWRWKRKKNSRAVRRFPQPLWLGADSLAGKSILLHSEQGLGDTIQFCRYATMVAELGARVILGVERPLARLLKQLDGVAEIVPSGGATSPFDYHCPMLSLPLAFKTLLETIPNSVPYLHAEAQRAQRWAGVIGKSGFKIGICWQGADVGRSFPLTLFREIGKIPNVRLISLQKGDGLAQLDGLPSDMTVECLGEDFDAGPDAFLDTAAVMTLCDLVITADTAVGHLAGALGVPTWVALQQVPDWRWQLEGTDSPWYPSTKLFRQPSTGDWQSVFVEMAAAIQAGDE